MEVNLVGKWERERRKIWKADSMERSKQMSKEGSGRMLGGERRDGSEM